MRKPRFNPRTVHMQIVVDIVAIERLFSELLCVPVSVSLNLCSILILPSPTLTVQLHSTVYDCCILTSCQHSYQDGYWQQDKSTAPTDAASPWLWLSLVLGDVELLTPADTTAAVNIEFTVQQTATCLHLHSRRMCSTYVPSSLYSVVQCVTAYQLKQICISFILLNPETDLSNIKWFSSRGT
jgi:hypothetical protein